MGPFIYTQTERIFNARNVELILLYRTTVQVMSRCLTAAFNRFTTSHIICYEGL
jgi:hypothetical protein